MKNSELPSRIGARRRVANVILLGWLLAGGNAGFAPALDAAERYWTGFGAGNNWSNPFSWLPEGVPQDGEDLIFGGLFNTDTSDTMVNDLPELTVRSMRFEKEQEGFLNETWILSGNELTVTGGIAFEQDIDFNCGLTLGRSIFIVVDRSWSLEDPLTIRFNGPINLGEHDLTIINRDPGPAVYHINSLITGQGNIRFVNQDPNDTTLAVFGGSQANTFTGRLSFEREPAARPFRASFDKPGGNVATSGLHIGDGCEVAVHRADQIGDDAAVSITGGGRLLLNGHAETLGSLSLTNVHADADPTLVDATGTTLTLRGDITTSVFNEDGNIPTIKGRLALSLGQHVFDLNNQLPPAPSLDLQATIVGAGGFSKFGNATLVLAIGSSFNGPVSVNDGILDIQHAFALGTAPDGLILNGGDVILRNMAIAAESLTVTAPGSLLLAFGPCSWTGSIALNQPLTIFSENFNVSGAITGTGDLSLRGALIEFSGSSPNAFTGATRVNCERLTLNKPATGTAFAFSGPLLIGQDSFVAYEVRWLNDSQINRTTTQVTLGSRALMNLNGHNDTIGSLVFSGGTVQNAGAGTLSLSQTITANVATATATISGGRLAIAAGVRTFHVDDGPLEPDLAISATILDFGGITKTGLGTLRLSGANTFLGSVNVNAGMVHIQSDLALGSTAGRTTVADGATLQIETAVALNEQLTVAGAGVGGTRGALLTSADVFVNSDLVLSGPAAIRTEGTNSRIQVNNISGTGPLTKLGSGRLVLRGNAHNTYSGDTLVTEGVLDLAKPNGIASIPGHLVIGTTPVGSIVPSAQVEHRANFTVVGSVTVNAGGVWDLNGALEDWIGADLQGRPPLTLNDGGDVQTGAGIFILPAGGGIVVNPGSQRFANSTISGSVALDAGTHRITVLQGNQSFLSGPECNLTAALIEGFGPSELEKDGGGRLRLAGTNTYRGATLVTGGTLQVDGVQPQSAARVFDGGRLQGLGTVGSIEMLGATAIVAPGVPSSFLGTGSGILTCSNFNFGAVNDGILFVELNGTTPGSGYDQINARGSVRLTGLTLQGSLGFASSIGQQFTIINNDGADPIQGTFEGLPQGASLYIGGERFFVSYISGTGNDVVLTRQVTPQLIVTTLPATEVANYAVDFDGENDRVTVGTNTFPAIVNNFTIEVWANPTASRTETAEASTGISDIASQRHAVFPDQGDLGYGAGHAGAGLSIGNNGVSVFEHAGNHLPSLLVYSNVIAGWTHVALVCSNRQPRLYVNGRLVRIGLVSAKTSIHPSANLGGSIQGRTYGNFQGQLDEVRIWNAALSQAQIQTNLNRSLTGSEPGLVLYYRCEETNGAPLVDSAPATPNPAGTLNSGAASVLSGALPPETLNGPTVTLNGLANPDSVDASVWFEWGATTNYGNVTAAQSVSAVTRTASFSETLAGLAAGEYQFRAVGSNGLHFSFGLNQTFTLLNGAPLLCIEAVTAGQVRLLWPTNAVGFTLQSNPDLNTTNWSSVPALPVSVVGTNNVALDATTSGRKFYRLFHP